VLAPLLVGASGPQSPQATTAPASAPAPPQASVFRADVEYVEVEAFVTDEAGQAVSGLSRADFQVFEEGVREEIAVFAEVRIPLDRQEPPVAEPAQLPQEVATNEEGIRGRVFALVLDELHTDARRSGEVRRLAREFVERHMARDDVAAIVSTGGRADATVGFTGDRRRLVDAIERFAGRKARSATLERLDTIESQRDLLAAESDARDAPAPPERALVPRPGLERDASDLQRVHDARAAMETLERAARSFGGLDGRRKAIVWFGEGIDYDTLDVMGRTKRDATGVRDSLRSAIATATRHGVAVYAVDPRGGLGGAGGPEEIQMTAPASGAALGVDSQSLAREARLAQQSLRTVAEQTGGIAFVGTNDFDGAFERIVRASSLYYLLGYYPPDSRRDGAYRRLEVRVTRPGLRVLAREGYARPGPEPEKDVRPRIAAADGTSPELRTLLESPWPQPGLPLAVTAASFKGSGRDTTVAVTILLPRPGPPPQPGAGAHETEVSFVAIDTNGNVRAGERILSRSAASATSPESGVRPGLRFVRALQLSAGRYQLRVAARESDTLALGSVSYELEVPDYGNPKLAMSSVLISSRQAASAFASAIDETMKARLKVPPTADRRFEAGDVVSAYAEVYDALESPHEVGMTTRVVATGDGREVFRDTRLRAAGPLEGAGAGIRHEIEIPLAGLRPGRYQLEIAATPTLGEPTASREVAFEVVPSTETASADVGARPPASPARYAEGAAPVSRVARLQAWLAAVEQHRPGTFDASALMVRAWTPPDLLELAADIALIAALIRDPGHPVLWQVDPEHPGRPQRSPYGPADEVRLRALAKEAAARCGTPSCARNRLLKRGALLHTDALLRAQDQRPAGRRGEAPERFAVRYRDGRQDAAEEAPGQLELAQALLDNVAPAPERDETVRIWYIAVSAYGQYFQRYTRQEERGVQLFPKDADLLLLAGTFHEVLASPRIQSLVRSIHVPGGVSHGIEGARSELREAEKRLRRAVAARPYFDEARIRLGHVLEQQGRSEEAARQLEQARSRLTSAGGKADGDGGLLLYYAEMFLGAASESLGRFDAAKASYGRAAALYPQAPSPRLAQSQLALRTQDRARALAAVQVAVRPFTGPDSADPWWRYHEIQGRSCEAWLEKLYQSATAEP
jgi:VWFA-related protein